jgi:hypothetical protein
MNLKPNKLDLHCQQSSHDVEDVVCHINPLVESVSDDEENNKDWDNVDDERIASPRCNHIKIAFQKIKEDYLYAKEA